MAVLYFQFLLAVPHCITFEFTNIQIQGKLFNLDLQRDHTAVLQWTLKAGGTDSQDVLVPGLWDSGTICTSHAELVYKKTKQCIFLMKPLYERQNNYMAVYPGYIKLPTLHPGISGEIDSSQKAMRNQQKNTAASNKDASHSCFLSLEASLLDSGFRASPATATSFKVMHINLCSLVTYLVSKVQSLRLQVVINHVQVH